MRFLILSLMLSIAGSAYAEVSSEAWWRFGKAADEVSGASDMLFTPEEKRMIRQFFNENRHYLPEDDDAYAEGRDKPKKKKRLPPGLQKKLARGGELPPGWQKKVARGEVLDGELYADSVYLPGELRHRLPEERAGTEIRRIENKVIRLLDATHEILDVFELGNGYYPD